MVRSAFHPTAGERSVAAASAAASGDPPSHQGLTLVHFSAEAYPFLTQITP